jgi:hypothetical protein
VGAPPLEELLLLEPLLLDEPLLEELLLLEVPLLLEVLLVLDAPLLEAPLLAPPAPVLVVASAPLEPQATRERQSIGAARNVEERIGRPPRSGEEEGADATTLVQAAPERVFPSRAAAARWGHPPLARRWARE